MPALVELERVTKDYRGLRPLRIETFALQPRERVAISGLDVVAAEVLVNLITAAILPDAGDVRVAGESTRAITTEEAWLASLDRFGIVTERALLLEGSSLLQNIALPLTVEIDPVPDAVGDKVRLLAREVGLEETWLDRHAANLPAAIRIRVHLARALAQVPQVLLLEHPTAALERDGVERLAKDVRRVAAARQLALLVISQDAAFISSVAERRLILNPATGALTPKRGFGWW